MITMRQPAGPAGSTRTLSDDDFATPFNQNDEVVLRVTATNFLSARNPA
jgi:hypothetical protein